MTKYESDIIIDNLCARIHDLTMEIEWLNKELKKKESQHESRETELPFGGEMGRVSN